MGIDLEHVNPSRLAALKRASPEMEQVVGDVDCGKDSSCSGLYLTMAWSLKESLYKALGGQVSFESLTVAKMRRYPLDRPGSGFIAATYERYPQYTGMALADSERIIAISHAHANDFYQTHLFR
jgi:phosphopantetheinyl transferase (holo-ACP synthase)